MGTITDFDGNFMLDVPTKSVLVISYIGYVTQEVPTAGKKSLEIILKEDTKTLDEVVVIGYGSARKSDVTGSIASVAERSCVRCLPPILHTLLQNRVAGVDMAQTSSAPGAFHADSYSWYPFVERQ